MSIDKPDAPSVARNRDAILDVLRDVFANVRSVLEVGSGTAQHAVYFARAMPHLSWQASDRAENLAGMRAWLDDAALPNTPAPIAFDVAGPWPDKRFDAVFTANTLHIMAIEQVRAFFAGLPGVTSPGALLVVYGPFNYEGRFTSQSNAAFNQWLQARGKHMAIRDIETIDNLAGHAGFVLLADGEMPANNRCVVWKRAC